VEEEERRKIEPEEVIFNDFFREQRQAFLLYSSRTSFHQPPSNDT
jgi:hypothetical protein